MAAFTPPGSSFTAWSLLRSKPARQTVSGTGVRKVALLGTRYTMTQDFYKSRLIDRGFEVLIPDAAGVETVNSVIYKELCLGIIKEESRVRFSQIITGLKEQGAEAVILGCTEIGLLVQQENSVLPVFDTTEIHAVRAAELALQD